MSAEQNICQLCHKENFRYTCPKCNILYCSVACYKSPEHIKCSEEFYRNCIQDEIAAGNASDSREDMRKIYDILRRIHEADAGGAPDFANDVLDETLDSDDDDADETLQTSDSQHFPPTAEAELEDDQDEEDMAVRLQNVNLNDADEIWQRLTDAERADFQKMIEDGQIMKLLPNYKPWWIKEKNSSKIVELPTCKDGDHSNTTTPAIATNIHKFSSICKKTPSPCLHYNLWNILAAYACVVRFFNGDHLTMSDEATGHLVNLSLALKFGTNFEDVEDAIISVEMEALTTKNSNAPAMATHLVESREKLQSDARQLMSTIHNKLAALSDILQLLQLAKIRMKRAKTEQTEFHKLFAIRNGSVQLDRSKLSHLIKKIEFLLSYVNRETDDSN